MKKADKKFQEFKNVITVMEENLSLWNHMSGLRNSYDSFVRNFKNTEELLLKANQKLDAVFENKLISKQNLIISLQPLLKVTQLYAKDNKKKKLSKKVTVKMKKLENSSDTQLIKFSSYILKKLRALQDQEKESQKTLKPENYGINDERLNDLDKELKNFIQLNSEFDNLSVEKKNAKSKVKKLVKKNDKILKNRMDKFLLLFRTGNEGFYKSYRIARNKTK